MMMPAGFRSWQRRFFICVETTELQRTKVIKKVFEFVLVRESFYLVRGSLYLSKKNYSMFRADVTVMFQQACCELQQPGTRLLLSPVVMLIREMDRK